MVVWDTVRIDHLIDYLIIYLLFIMGFIIDLINKRLTQKLLINPYIGPVLAALNSRISEPIARKLSLQQLSSIYGPEANPDHRIEDIEAMFSLTRYNGGSGLVHKTCSYLIDRARFESRWYRALGHLDIPCMLLWGKFLLITN